MMEQDLQNIPKGERREAIPQSCPVFSTCVPQHVYSLTYHACVHMHISTNEIKTDFTKRSGFCIDFKFIIKIHRRALMGEQANHIPWVHY